mgnify:CR=1 FL=1
MSSAERGAQRANPCGHGGLDEVIEAALVLLQGDAGDDDAVRDDALSTPGGSIAAASAAGVAASVRVKVRTAATSTATASRTRTTSIATTTASRRSA